MVSKPRVISISLKQVPRMFNLDSKTELCARDIIAYVRGELEPDPWVPVVLETNERPVAQEELEEYLIFWSGINEKAIERISGVSSRSYCVVKASSLSLEEYDCGLSQVTSDFANHNLLTTFDILIVGDNVGTDRDIVIRLRDYALSHEREDIVFPRFIVLQNKLMDNGLDISQYAQRIAQRRSRNSLTAEFMDEILAELDKAIQPELTVIQDLQESRTQNVKLLSLYLALHYNLPPIYVASFIDEYLRYEFCYPFRRLSLYERLRFLRLLPSVVGYLGKNQSFNCLARVTRKIYPKPHYIWSLDTGELIAEEIVNGDEFTLGSTDLQFVDFRTTFPGSSVPINYTDVNKSGVSLGGDATADMRWVDTFIQLSSQVTDEPVYLSVKNSVIFVKGQEKYLAYCPEECGILAVLISEQFGAHEMLITEVEFKHLIDAQIERAILQKDRAPSGAAGGKALATAWRQLDTRIALQPALPLEVSLYLNLLPFNQNGLSYYDRALRCHKDILPIITSTDSPLFDVSPLFREISLSSLRDDPQARYAINCFGTFTKYVEQRPLLPVTYQAFKQRGLL